MKIRFVPQENMGIEIRAKGKNQGLEDREVS